nr:hypothetical protein [uncultured Allomuricauda sp.]
MRKMLLPLIFLMAYNSCIPLRIAPTIKDYRVVKGKKFKKGLPKKTMFIFEDPKEENEFYNYINTKFDLNDYYVDVEIPFELDGEEFFFSFYEVEIPTKTINLIPLVMDGILSQTTEMDPVFEDVHTSRIGNWYLAIEVFSDKEQDCLHENSPYKQKLLTYLGQLKNEYLNTVNYNEVVFKN